jgi:hypothetical protein
MVDDKKSTSVKPRVGVILQQTVLGQKSVNLSEELVE